MARQYKCAACKRGFKNKFALSAHIRFCKKQKMVKCPECRKICSRKGLAIHRFHKHDVAGTSRWALKARKVKKSPKATVRDRMEAMVRKSLKKPFFQEILREWALQIEDAVERKVVDATTFANLYLEMLRDPRNDEARQGCTALANFMKPRSWKKMIEVLRGAADKETLATFGRPEAEQFYTQFKAIVLETIRDYWEQFLKSRVKEKPVQTPPPIETWKDQAIRVATDKIAFHNAEIKRLEEYIEITKELP